MAANEIQYFRNRRLLISYTKHCSSKRLPFCANDFNFHFVQCGHVALCWFEGAAQSQKAEDIKGFPPFPTKCFSLFARKLLFPHFDSDFRVPEAGRVQCAQQQPSRFCQLIEKKCFRSIFYEIPSSIVKCGLGCFKRSLGLRLKSLIKETEQLKA